MQKRGKFITFEGIDGSGKTTQIERLAAELRCSGKHVLLLREPGGTVVSEAVRDVLLNPAYETIVPETELLLFAAARAQLVREVIEPALAEGTWVICDRFFDSTTAYQGFGRGMDVVFIENLNRFAVGGLEPDLTFLFDLPVELALTRLGSRPEKADRLDSESRTFMEKTRQGYLDILARETRRIVSIDASRSVEQVYSSLREVLEQGGYNI